MSMEWQERLQHDFPFMRPDGADHEGDPYQWWGFECAGGWEAILRECCESIVRKYAEYGIGLDDINFVPTQVKEKYGTLRFYYEYKKAPCALLAIEETKKLHHEIEEIIDEAEEKSETTCELCGAPGVLRDHGGWLTTLCDACEAK